MDQSYSKSASGATEYSSDWDDAREARVRFLAEQLAEVLDQLDRREAYHRGVTETLRRQKDAAWDLVRLLRAGVAA